MVGTGGEDKRRQYLARMGIATPWLVRAPAPAPLPADKTAAVNKPVRRLAESLVAEPALPLPVVATPPRSREAVLELVEPETVAPFTLLMLRASHGVLLLDTLEGQQKGWPAARLSLATDLLQALDGLPVTIEHEETLGLPLAGRKGTVSLAEATDLVRGCLRRQADGWPLVKIVLLGDRLCDWLAPDADRLPLLQRQLPQVLPRCLFLPGWPDGLDAQAKRALWRAMAAVHAGQP